MTGLIHPALGAQQSRQGAALCRTLDSPAARPPALLNPAGDRGHHYWTGKRPERLPSSIIAAVTASAIASSGFATFFTPPDSFRPTGPETHCGSVENGPPSPHGDRAAWEGLCQGDSATATTLCRWHDGRNACPKVT